MKSVFYNLLFVFLLFSCNTYKNNYSLFKGNLVHIKNTPKSKNLLGERIKIHVPFWGIPKVYDSLMFFAHPRNKEFSYYCINLNTGKIHAKYLKKGRGPNEYLNATPFFQIVKNSKGESVGPFMAINERNYGIFNIDKSIETKQTVLDTIFKEKWDNNYLLPFTYTFSLGNNAILGRNEPAKLFVNEEKYSSPKYLKFSTNSDIPEREYELFDSYYNEHLEEMNNSILLSTDAIHPDRKKLALAMYYVNQINIVDLESGKVQGFVMPGFLGIQALDQIDDKKKLPLINKCISVDENYIYVLYFTENPESNSNFENLSSNTINVFDWKGNFVRCLKLSKNIEFFTLDSKKKLLYGTNTADEAIYRFKL